MNKVLIRQKFSPGSRSLAEYRRLIGAAEYNEILSLSKKLKGKKIVYINSTPNGGGVVELLKSLIPLMKSLGLDVDWYVIEENKRFFEISKKLHNSLQGSTLRLAEAEKKFYNTYSKIIAGKISEIKPDILMLQDPQPLGSLAFLPPSIHAVSRIHIDLTKPNPDSNKFVRTFLAKAAKTIFTMKEFAPKDLPQNKILISPPAIDPLSNKNKKLTEKQLQAVAEVVGIDRTQHLVSQVSRFDFWKDPMGVIQSFHLIRDDYADAKLVLMGLIEAQDDPEAQAVFENVKKYVKDDPNIVLISKQIQLQGIPTDIFVNAIQTMSDVVFQKSIREGFGLTVTEAMWKGRPVVGGDVGGIRLQIQNGKNGFLVRTPKDAAKIGVRLIYDKKLARKIGQAAKKTVADNFLITRYLRDELRVMLKTV